MFAVYTLKAEEVGTRLGSVDTLDKAIAMVQLYEQYGSPFAHIIEEHNVLGLQNTYLLPSGSTRISVKITREKAKITEEMHVKK